MHPSSLHNPCSQGARAAHSSALGQAAIAALQTDLRRAGVLVRVRSLNGRSYVSGAHCTATAHWSVSERSLEGLRMGALSGLATGVHLPTPDDTDSLGENLGELTARLPRTHCALSIDCRELEASVAIDALRASRWRARASLLLRADHAGGNAAAHEWAWRSLAPNGAPATLATPALCAGVRSCCPLLPAESSSTVASCLGMTVPAATAWLPLGVDLVRFMRSDATIDRSRLKAALDLCVRHGDALHDHLGWPGSAQAHDARLNRRLAIFISGIGDIAASAFADPSSLACLRELDELLGWIHSHLWNVSRALAEQRGALPALKEKQPSRRWRDASHRQDWETRWKQAVARVQVRNRNLLVLSPYALLPRNGRATPAYADLMPLLAHADAVGAVGPPWLWRWQASDLKNFYDRMRAQIVRLNATSFIAAGA